MEKLTDILARTGKATVRELAAILKIDFRDALALLHDHEQAGQMVCINGYWQLTAAEPESATVNTKVKTPRVGADALLKLLAEHGAMTAEDLAKRAGVTARKVASTLAMATSKGKVLRQPHNGKFRYALPDQKLIALPHDIGAMPGPASASALCLPVEPEYLPLQPENLPLQPENLPVTANAAPESTITEPDITIQAPTANQTPLKVIWSAPDNVQEFPTLAWVRQRRRELRNEMRWLSQIENIARQISRKKAAVAYFSERV